MDKVNFVKMHGAGNDYIYIDAFQQKVDDAPELARRLSHRRFGVGGDGLVLIAPSKVADARMIMYNADGSLSKNCGNALRCIAKFVHDSGISKANPMKIETGAGVFRADLNLNSSGELDSVSITFPPPSFRAGDISAAFGDESLISEKFSIAGQNYTATLVSMGNPHFVTYCEDVSAIPLEQWGPAIENHTQFTERINVEFVQIISRSEVLQRTWERGSGETWACGSGAAAVCAAGVVNGVTENQLKVRLTGGELNLSWGGDKSQPIIMTGPAVEVFRGTLEI